jgi:outer membrane protein assembly factor BamD (BamD/ComL family)
LISAKSYYENFKLRYPETAAKIGVDETLKAINEQVADKELLIADYYAKSGYKLSANLYYQMVVDDWPGTVAAKKARTKIK